MDTEDIAEMMLNVLMIVLFGALIVIIVFFTILLCRYGFIEALSEAPEEEPSITTEEVEVQEAYGTGAITDTVDDECYVTYGEVEALAKVLYRECRGNPSTMEKSAVAWCVLNRVDNPYYPDTILGVLEAPNQFAYDKDTPVTEELEQLALDVLKRWHDEKNGVAEVGRTLPSNYYYFIGDGEHNYFTAEWQSTDYWDWSLDNPYEN